MNRRDAKVIALHATMLQVEALLDSEFLHDFEPDDLARVERELQHISDRLYDRVTNLDPDHDVVPETPTIEV